MIETNRTYKVEVAQGQTFMDQIQFVDENNTPFDWTGWTGWTQIDEGGTNKYHHAQGLTISLCLS